MGDITSVRIPAAKALERELLKRELEKSFHKFVQYAFLKQEGKRFITKEFHLELISHMEAIHRGEKPASVGNVPPRYGKTLICIILFTAWAFAKNPKCRFIHLSFSESLVLNNSGEIRDIIQSDWFQEIWPMKIRKDINAKNEWATEAGGVFYAAPTGGQVTGRGAGASDIDDEEVEVYEWLKKYDQFKSTIESNEREAGFQGMLSIDDPTKPDDGSSEAIMGKTNARLNNTIMSRRNSPTKTPILIIMQRISEIDMTAFCLDGNTGEDWDHLCIPAIREDENGNEYAIWPEKHSLKKLNKLKEADPKTFSGQYGQLPTPEEGEMFHRDKWNLIDVAPADGNTVRGYDLAASKRKTAAKTASVKITEKDGVFYIVDVQADRLSPAEVERNMISNAEMDGISCGIDFPQDPGQAGKFQAEYMTAKLAGYIVESSPETGSKEERARAMSSQQAIGNVYLVKGSWNKAFIEEATSFPNGKLKDMIDAASRAFHAVLKFAAPSFDDTEENDDNISNGDNTNGIEHF